MIRSFVTLAESLNLSKTEKTLNTTRQTIRRHINTLEKARGEKLLELVDRQYCLTEVGQRVMPEAKTILARGQSWFDGSIQHFDGLERAVIDGPDGTKNLLQQHHVSRIWVNGTDAIREGFNCWTQAENAIESEKLQPIRPKLLICRPIAGNWQYVEVGEKSLYANWFGWTWAKSAIGLTFEQSPSHSFFTRSISPAYVQIYEAGGVRYDHFIRIAPKGAAGPLHVLKYQRLLLGCVLPDGSPAVAVLADQTDKIEISGFSETDIANLCADVPEAPSIISDV